MSKLPELRFGYDNLWTKGILLKFAEVKQGFPFNSKNYVKSGKYNIITIGNVGGQRFVRNINESNKISNIPNEIQSHQILKENDILVSMTGNVGRVSLNKGNNNLLNQRVGVISHRANASNEFLFQRLSNSDFESKMNLIGQGAAQLNISNSDIENYDLLVPELDEQERIADFLLSIDSLIEQKKNELDIIIKYKNTMLYNMFPKKGSNVPEIKFKGFSIEWRPKAFGDLYEIYNGLNKEKSAFGSGIPIINYMDVNRNVMIKDSDIKGRVELSQNEINSNIVNQGDILLARTSEVMDEVAFSSAYVGCLKNVVFSGFLLKAEPLEKRLIDPIFIALYIRYCENARDQINKLATKTSRALINGENLKKLIVSIPDIKEQEKISIFFTNLDELINSHKKEIQTLERLKTSLLSKMFA